MKVSLSVSIVVTFLITGCAQQILNSMGSQNQASSTGKGPTPPSTVDPSPGPTPVPPPAAPPISGPIPSPQIPESYTGKVTSFPVPALAGAPYSTLTNSKHTNMASDGKRIYVSGGDWVHSATDGTWSMDLKDGSWRQDIGIPVYPTLPAPHALQDGAGFVWIAAKQKFLMWPGSYFPYEAAGTPILNYSVGMWWLDPATNTYEQDLTFFSAKYSSTGSVYGGIYDEVNNHIVEFGDSSGGMFTHRWDLTNKVKLQDVPYSVANLSGYAAYFTRTQHVKIGRYVYILGYRTKGDLASQKAMFLRWHLDNHTMEELPAPVIDGSKIKDLEVRMGESHGKVVWPFTTGPDGEIYGIYIYDPSANKWYLDSQVPAYGNFIGNSLTSLTDGRVVWSGGVFGRHQTHIWFYECN